MIKRNETKSIIIRSAQKFKCSREETTLPVMVLIQGKQNPGDQRDAIWLEQTLLPFFFQSQEILMLTEISHGSWVKNPMLLTPVHRG